MFVVLIIIIIIIILIFLLAFIINNKKVNIVGGCISKNEINLKKKLIVSKFYKNIK